MADHLVSLTVPTPSRDSEQRARTALADAEEISIVTVADYEAAAAQLKAIKSKWNEIDDMRKALKRPIDEAAKRIQQFFAAPLQFLTDAESLIKRKMLAFTDELERIRRADQARADEAARRERARLARRAAKAATSGKIEKAADLEQRAATVVAPIVTRETPKIAGQSTREIWNFEVTDESQLPREYLVPDTARIRRVVTALRGDTRIPGVRVFAEKRLASGS